MKQIALRPYSETEASKSTYASMEAFYIIDELQKAQDGIRFDITLKNKDSTGSSFFNPLDYLKIDLQDSEGWPVRIPGLINPTMICHNPNAIAIRPFNASLTLVTGAGRTELNKDLRVISMDSGDEVIASISLEKVLPTAKPNSSPVPDTLRALSKGSYNLRVAFTLLSPSSPDTFKQCGSPYVTIQLT
jgi:hypothetical protein